MAYRHMAHWNLTPDRRLQEMICQCTTCGKCEILCRVGIEIPRLVELLRRDLYKKHNMPLLKKHEKALGSIRENMNPYSEPREKRFASLEEPSFEPAEYLYFVGCTSAFRTTGIAKATWNILRKLGVDISLMNDEVCCGSVLLRIGLVEEAKKLAMENVKNIRGSKAKAVITSCAGCYHTLLLDYPELLGKPRLWEELNVKVLHSSEILNELISNRHLQPNMEGKEVLVTYHDPCYIGRHCGLYEEPRAVINSISGVKLVEMLPNVREEANCCGAGGGGNVQLAFTDESLKIAKRRIREAKETGAQYLISTCPFCMLQLGESAKDEEITVLDLTEFLEQTGCI